MRDVSRNAITKALDERRAELKRTDETIAELEKSHGNYVDTRRLLTGLIADLEADLRDAQPAR